MRVEQLLPSVAAIVAAMLSIQSGAGIAKGLFPTLSAEGTTFLRLLIATLLLSAVYRPWQNRAWLAQSRARWLLLCYGLSLGAMNLLFYIALRGLPLGITVAIEFLGPLTVAVIASRRRLDFVWAALAIGGLALLIPSRDSDEHLGALSLLAALGAATTWALYIVFGQRLARSASVGAGQMVTCGMMIATVVALPGVLTIPPAAYHESGWMVPVALVALLSSAIPYPLEMGALRHLPQKTFGILMSLEPALAALAGWFVLHEPLTAVQWAAIASVMVASAGTAVTAAANR